MNTQKTRTTIWTTTFISIFIVNFAQNMGQYMMNTLIPKYADHLGATASVVGIVTSLFALSALAIRPFAGPAFDCFSKKRLLSIAIGFILLAFVGYSFATTVPMMMVCRLIHGIGIGCTAPLGLAIASDSLPEEKMASGLGIFSLAQAVSSAVGPSIGLSLAAHIGYNRSFAIGAVIMCIAFVLTFFIQEKPRTEPRSRYKISPDKILAKDALVPAAIMLFLAMAYSCINAFIAIYGSARGVEQIGLFFTFYAMFLLVTRPLSGVISDRLGLDKVIIPACCLFGLAFYLISIANTLPMFLIAGSISAFGYGACQPAMQALCMKAVPRERRGAGANTNYFGVDIGNLIGPILAGKIVEAVGASSGSSLAGYSAMFRFMILPIAVALGIFLLTRRRLVKPGN